MSKKLSLAAFVAAVLFAAGSSASAASYVWTGSNPGSGASLWDTKQNWDLNNSYPSSAILDTAAFGATAGSLTPVVNVPAAANSITFTEQASGYTFSATGGNSLTVGTGGINNLSGVDQDINLSVAFSGDSSIALGSAGVLSLGSASLLNSGTLTISGWTGTPGSPQLFITQEPSGTFLSSVSFGLSYPQGALWNGLNGGELTPVPEPQTYAALFALGLLGFAIARRRMAVTA
jgi:hypothetical protein